MTTIPLHACLWVWFLSATAIQQGATRESEERPTEPAGIEVTYLANEGFLLSSGEDAVLIDAFVSSPYSSFAAVEGDVFARMVALEPPFDSVDFALTSHVHGDHFQAEPARQFLSAAKECEFASTPQIIESLGESWSAAATGDRVRSVFPELGETARVEVGDIQVEIFQLSHGAGRFAGIQNLGHVITLGGMTVLHLGDAAMDERSFTPHALEERELDIALIPYWYFADEDGLHIVREHVKARHLVACHVPPKELELVRDFLVTEHPDVVLLETCMESRRFGPRTER